MARFEERSVSAVVTDIIGNVQEIIRSEVRLVKAEIKQEVSDAASSASRLACGLALAFYAVGLLLLAAVYLLSRLMPAWIAALVVCLVVSAAAVTLITSGRRHWKQLHLSSERIPHTVKENVSWMNAQTK
jgi:uncharacterized membrane protein YqjE